MTVIIFVNILLMLIGVIVLRLDQTRQRGGDWSPIAPAPQFDPFRTYQELLVPTA